MGKEGNIDMTLKEKRKQTIERIERRLAEKYEGIRINGENCFLKEDGTVFHLCGLTEPFNAVVIEYASTIEEAEKNMSEDGDLFYMDEMTEDEIYQAMINEIED